MYKCINKCTLKRWQRWFERNLLRLTKQESAQCPAQRGGGLYYKGVNFDVFVTPPISDWLRSLLKCRRRRCRHVLILVLPMSQSFGENYVSMKSFERLTNTGDKIFLQKFRAGLVYSVFVYLGRFQKRWRIVIFLYISVQCQWQIQGLSLCIAEMALVSPWSTKSEFFILWNFQGRSMCWLNILRMHCKKVYTVTVQWGTVTCLSGVGGEYMDFKQLVITLSQSLFLQPTIN